MHTLDSAKKYYEELLSKIEQAKSDLDGFIQQKDNFVQSVKQQLGSDFVAEMFGQGGTSQQDAATDSRVGMIITAENWDEMRVGDEVECIIGDSCFYGEGDICEVGYDHTGDFGPLNVSHSEVIYEFNTSGVKFRITKSAQDNGEE